MFGDYQDRVRTRPDAVGADVVFRPHQVLRDSELRRLFSGPWRVIINQQDTIAVDFPNYYPSPRHYELVVNVQKASLRRADYITTISYAAQREVLRFCPDLEPRRFKMVHDGADHLNVVESHRPQAVSPDRPFLAVVGSAFLHKNRLFALDVMEEMLRRGYEGDLVLIGVEPFFGSSIAEEAKRTAVPSALHRRVLNLGPVPNAEKWWILEHADAVLYPSTLEGFGLIPFEAALMGTPCLCANVSSLPEVCGPDATLAHGFDVAEWAQILTGWLRDPPSAKRQVEVLRRRRETFRWDNAAVGIWDAIDETMALPRRWPGDQLGPRSVHVERASPGLSRPDRLLHETRRGMALMQRRVESALRREPVNRGYRSER